MALRNEFGAISLESTQASVLAELQTQQKDALTRAQLDSAPVVVNTGLIQPTTPADTQPVSGTVELGATSLAALEQTSVTLLNPLLQGTTPTDVQPVSATSLPLPAGAATESKQLPDGHKVKDFFTQQEILTTQVASGSQRLTFTFTAPVHLAYVFMIDQTPNTGNFTANGSIPTGSYGIPLMPGTPFSVPCLTTVIEVFCSSGAEVRVWGYRYG
jgi:hypothetical protein